MQDKDNSKEEIVKELIQLRNRLKQLEAKEGEKEEACRAFKASDHMYSILVENSKDGILIIQAGLIKFINKEALSFMGYTDIEIVGASFLKLIAPTSMGMVQKRYNDRMSGKNVPDIYEADLITKEGVLIIAEISTVVIEYENALADLVFVRNITDRKRMEEQLRKTRDELEVRVKERTAELAFMNQQMQEEIAERKKSDEELRKSYEKLQDALNSTVQAIATIVESRDPYTAGHQRRVAALCCAIATVLEFSEEEIKPLKVAATVHDIGKIYVPAEILSKPGHLPEIEYNLIKNHPEVGYNILKDIKFPWPVADIVLQHHEHIDGSGYPRGLKKDEILLEAKIICVSDVIEAMATHRPYRASLGMDAALKQISDNRGILYDEDIVDACLEVIVKQGFAFD